MKILLGEGLITSDGEVHRRQRRIAAPAFHRQRIQKYGAMMVERAGAMREEWQPGREIDIAAEMMRLTLQVVARTLFNTDVTEDVQAINDEVNVIMDLYNFLDRAAAGRGDAASADSWADAFPQGAQAAGCGRASHDRRSIERMGVDARRSAFDADYVARRRGRPLRACLTSSCAMRC